MPRDSKLHALVRDAGLSDDLTAELTTAVDGTHPRSKGAAHDIARAAGHGGSFTKLANLIIADKRHAADFADAVQLSKKLARFDFRNDEVTGDEDETSEPTPETVAAQIERPRSQWTKDDLRRALDEVGVDYDDDALKTELEDLAEANGL